jgi:transcriptional regulator with XRE-family HTH domain
VDPKDAAPRVAGAGRWLRAVRRQRQLSQRELADRAKVPLSTISRIESGASVPRLDTFVAILARAGYELVISDNCGRMLQLDADHDRLRDRGNRRFPAHLESGKTPWYFDHENPNRWWGWERIAWPFTDDWVPEHTYWRRPAPWGTGKWGFLDGPPEQPWEDAT